MLGLLACRPKTPPPGLIASDLDPTPAYSEGTTLNPEAAERLKQSVEKDPTNEMNRIELLGYYNTRPDATSQAAAREQMVWLIANKPTVNYYWIPVYFDRTTIKEEFRKAKQLWLDQVQNHPNEPIVFCNAAHFLAWEDSRKAEELLDRASALNPNVADIYGIMGDLYHSCSLSGPAKNEKQLVMKSISSYEKQLSLLDQGKFPLYLTRESALTELIKRTYFFGQTERAAKYSTELLQALSSNPKMEAARADRINLANTVLGLRAIETGDTETAGNYLVESGKVGKYKIGEANGPNMCLAKSLIELGKGRVVMSYLRECEAIWPRGIENLHKWEAMIDNGQTPPFYCEVDTR